MFDARTVLDELMRGSGPQQQGNRSPLMDLLRQLQVGDREAQQTSGTRSSDNESSGRQEILAAPASVAGPASLPQEGSSGATSSAGLQDMLRNVLGGGGSMQDVMARLQQQGSRVGDILVQVLGGAASGVREGATRIDDATSVSRHARDVVTQATGCSPEQIFAQLKKLVADNPGAARAGLAGLGALILGTAAGRSLAGSAVKLGSLALVGGLAYKAYQNHQRGRPILGDGKAQGDTLELAPVGSGFEPGAVTHERATLLIRAMIAAAAADGRIDDNEQQKIIAGLKQAGLESDAEQFLTREVTTPATIDQLASGVSSPEEGVQVYTAARIAIDPDTEEENGFLIALAIRLGIDDSLAAQIDAAARRIAA